MPQDSPFITIVSGLPRSGTSMMMRMLDQGGVPAFIDRERVADIDNPNGYYEFERVKALPEDKDWLHDAIGHAIKVIYKLVYELPSDHSYRVVFMARPIDEVMASQNKMLSRSEIVVSEADTAQFAALFKADLQAFRSWVAEQSHVEILYVDYREVLEETEAAAAKIGQFLGADLDMAAMSAVVNPELYRNRTT